MLIGFASTVGGVLYYRCQLPAIEIRAAREDFEVFVGTEVDVSPGGRIGIATSSERGVDPDVLILAGGHPSSVGATAIRDARRKGQWVVCDCDDWPELPSDNPHWRPGLADRKLAALRAASAVSVSTPYLQDCLRASLIRSTVIRNRIVAEHFAQPRTSPGTGLARVAYRGYLGGFHDGDVLQLSGEGLEALPARWIHVGATDEGKRFGDLAGVSDVVERPAVPFGDAYPPLLADVDLAVIPFSPRPFSQAKSNIAALEWSAAGVPWVASPHPEFVPLDQNAIVPRGVWLERLTRALRLRRREQLRATQRRALARFEISILGAWEWLSVAVPAAREGRPY
jgi:glycosyltransferase involved in cell wall biosynthesis